MRTKALDFPKSILIETLNICQGSCKFCPYRTIRNNETPTYLDYDIYKQMIDEISKYDVKRLTLFNNNEPLIDRRIYDFIKYARETLNDVEITLSSNGILVTNDVLIKLKESGLTHLYFSIPTLNENYYKDIMGVGIHNILNVLDSVSDKELLKMIRIAVPKTRFYNKNDFDNRLNKFLICTWDLEYKGNWGLKNDFAYLVEDLEYTGPCDRPLDQMVIISNGDSIICCRDWRYENVIGNVYKDSLYDIWHSDEMKRIQDLISKQDYDHIECCKDCNMNYTYYKKMKR